MFLDIWVFYKFKTPKTRAGGLLSAVRVFGLEKERKHEKKRGFLCGGWFYDNRKF